MNVDVTVGVCVLAFFDHTLYQRSLDLLGVSDVMVIEVPLVMCLPAEFVTGDVFVTPLYSSAAAVFGTVVVPLALKVTVIVVPTPSAVVRYARNTETVAAVDVVPAQSSV